MAKYAALGTRLEKGGTEYAQVTNISGPGLSLDTEDVTSHDSTGAWEEVVGTILRSGEVTLDIVYDPGGATHAALLVDLAARTIITTYTLDFPDAVTIWDFNALVVGFEPGAPVGGALTAVVKFKLTGAPTLR
jgi:hypothetical protein